MKIILLQNVPKVGHKFDVVTVANGYAMNFLFPQKLAETADPAKVALLEKRKEGIRASEETKANEIKEKLKSLGDTTVTITVKADEQGHLFKKIRTEDIVTALKDNAGIELPKESILLDEPLHEIGEHEVSIEAVDQKAVLKVQVVAE